MLMACACACHFVAWPAHIQHAHRHTCNTFSYVFVCVYNLALAFWLRNFIQLATVYNLPLCYRLSLIRFPSSEDLNGFCCWCATCVVHSSFALYVKPAERTDFIASLTECAIIYCKQTNTHTNTLWLGFICLCHRFCILFGIHRCLYRMLMLIIGLHFVDFLNSHFSGLKSSSTIMMLPVKSSAVWQFNPKPHHKIALIKYKQRQQPNKKEKERESKQNRIGIYSYRKNHKLMANNGKLDRKIQNIKWKYDQR